MDVSGSIHVDRAAELDEWLATHGSSKREVTVAIYKRASGRQTVTLVALQEIALCHGWVDTQTKRLDEERYAIRFVPRRPRSTWSAKNREMARRLLDEGRLHPTGRASLPADL